MSHLRLNELEGVFFDLDGTLVDTAPDMVGSLRQMQADHGCEPVDYSFGRSHVSNGAMGLVRIGFPGRQPEEYDALIYEYVRRYADRLYEESRLFDGLDAVLQQFEERNVAWGVVTNKPSHLTEPLLDGLGLSHRCASIVSGDTLPVKKPDPAPVELACRLAGCDPRRSIYIGDAARDIEAGNAAGLPTIAVTYGYITAGDDPYVWGADLVVDSVGELAIQLGNSDMRMHDT